MHNNNNNISRSIFFSSSTDKQLTSLVKRSIVTTGLCVLADLTAFILAMCLDEDLPSIYTNFVYDANLIFNVVFVIGSFADWRRRLGPFCKTKTSKDKKYVASIKSSKASATV